MDTIVSVCPIGAHSLSTFVLNVVHWRRAMSGPLSYSKQTSCSDRKLRHLKRRRSVRVICSLLEILETVQRAARGHLNRELT